MAGLPPCAERPSRRPASSCVTALLALALVSPAAAQTVPFKLAAKRYITVDVVLNDTRRAGFVLDTAATVSVICPALASRLALIREQPRVVVTHTGRQSMPFAVLDRLRVGPVTVTGLRVMVGDLGPLSAADPWIDGVLGQDVLDRANYLVDYRTRRIEFDPARRLAASLKGEVVPFERVRGRPLLVAQVAGRVDASAAPMRLAIDSAAASMTVFESRAGSRLPFRLGGLIEMVKTASLLGRRAVRKGSVDRLGVGGSVLRDVPATLMPRPAGWFGEVQDGLIPTALFHGFYWDHDASVVILNPERTTQFIDVDDGSTPKP